jgi:hypothetical protein
MGLYDKADVGKVVGDFGNGRLNYTIQLDYTNGGADLDQLVDAIVTAKFNTNALIVLGGCHGALYAPAMSQKLQAKGRGDIRIVGANTEANGGNSKFFVVQPEYVQVHDKRGRLVTKRVQGHLVLFQHGKPVLGDDIYDPKNFFITPTNKRGTLMP